MKLKSKKGLIIAYAEGLILVGATLAIGNWLRGGIDIRWNTIIFSLIVPVLVFCFDWLLKTKPSSVSVTVALMASFALYDMMPNAHFALRLLIYITFMSILWFLLYKLNGTLFPVKKETETRS